MKRFFLLIVAAVSIIGCSSLPFPHTPTESLLLAACEIEAEIQNGEEKIVEVVLNLSPEGDDNVDYSMKLPVNGGFAVMKLEPGTYTLDSAEITRREQRLFGKKTGNTVEVGRTVSIEARTIHLLRQKCVLNAGGGENGYNLNFPGFNGGEEQLDIYMSLKDDPRWPGWERYTLVNFPEDVKELAKKLEREAGKNNTEEE